MKFLLASLLALLVLVPGSADARPRRATTPVCNNVDIMNPCPQLQVQETFPATRAERRAVRAVKMERAMPFGAAVGDSSLLDRARAHLGTNPTGWRSLWCARFIALIAPQIAARVKNPNMARAYLPLSNGGCAPGALVVTSRGRGGGHIGVVESCNGGNPVTISGNHGRTVGRGTYSAARVLGYIHG